MDAIYHGGKAYYESVHSKDKMIQRFPTVEVAKVIRRGQYLNCEQINRFYCFRNSPVHPSRSGIYDESSGCILLMAKNGRKCFTIITAIHYLSEEDPEDEFNSFRLRSNRKDKIRRRKHRLGDHHGA